MLVGGKTTVYGDGALALVYASGLLDEFKEWSEGEGEGLTYFCRVKRKGESRARSRGPSRWPTRRRPICGRAAARRRTTGSSTRKRMMTMRARGFALRDKFPDVLKGLARSGRKSWRTPIRLPSGASVTPKPRRRRRNRRWWRIPNRAPVETSYVVAHRSQQPPIRRPRSRWPRSSRPPRPHSSSSPITLAQKEQLAELNKLIMAARGLREPAAKKAAWEQVLAPYGVASAKSLTAGQAADLIEQLGKEHDPFGHPAGHASTA
jgi:hypothetical protein